MPLAADLPLAAFLSAAAPPNRKCPHPQCGEGAPLHLRSFMHGAGLVTLSSVRLPAGKSLEGDLGWDVFSLQYHVEGPLAAVLSPDAMAGGHVGQEGPKRARVGRSRTSRPGLETGAVPFPRKSCGAMCYIFMGPNQLCLQHGGADIDSSPTLCFGS